MQIGDESLYLMGNGCMIRDLLVKFKFKKMFPQIISPGRVSQFNKLKTVD